MRLALALALALACAPAPAPTATEAPAFAPAPPRTLPAELAGLVEPWHPFDPSVADASTVWLLTRYEPGTYPCRPGPDGSLDMLLQDRFTVVRVLRGAASAPGIDLDLYQLRGPGRPRDYAEGRRYLLFLRPGPAAQDLLADPDALGGPGDRLGPEDVLGVIDLDVSAGEAAAESAAASRSGELDGVRWDPAGWHALRLEPTPRPAAQRALVSSLQGLVLRPRAPLAAIRAWLGPPDDQRLGPGRARRDDYILARPAYLSPAHDAIYGDLRLHFDDRLELRRVELTYLRWRVSPGERASVALTAEEHADLGLPQLALEYR